MRSRLRVLRLLVTAPAALLLSRAASARGSRQQPQAEELHVLLPSVSQLAQTTPGATLTTLADVDCGFVAAVYDPIWGLPILTYIIRPYGNRLHVDWDMGERLEPLPDPDLALARLVLGGGSPGPGFVFPGPKQGTAALLLVGGMLHIYVTSRDEEDETGPFKLKRLSMPVPAPP